MFDSITVCGQHRIPRRRTIRALRNVSAVQLLAPETGPGSPPGVGHVQNVVQRHSPIDAHTSTWTLSPDGFAFSLLTGYSAKKASDKGAF